MRLPTCLMSLRTIFKVALIGALALLVFAAVPALYFFLNYYHSLEDEVVTRFSQKHWNIPSRIYSDSTVIYPGLTLKDLGFFERLARLNYHHVESGKVTERGEYSYDPRQGKLVIFLHNFAYPYTDFAGEAIEMTLGPRNMVLAMRDPLGGKALFSAELEPELISGIFQGSWQQRRLVPLAQIPPALIDAIETWAEHWNDDPKPFVWHAEADKIIEKVRRGRAALTEVKSATQH